MRAVSARSRRRCVDAPRWPQKRRVGMTWSEVALVAGFVAVCVLGVAAALGADLLWLYVRALVVGEALR